MFPECIECRGTREMCGISPCPLLADIRGRLPTVEAGSVSELVGPSPPSLFVGRFGYPKVRTGPSAAWIPDEERMPPPRQAATQPTSSEGRWRRSPRAMPT